MTEIKYAGIKIAGSTTINHDVRNKLNISNDQYVLLDFLKRAHEEKRDITYEVVFRKIAMTYEEFEKVSESLYKIDMIRSYKEGEKTFIRVAKRFREAFYIEEIEFNEFWSNPKTGNADWPGSRSDALAKYITARKLYPHDYLMKQKHWYFRMLALPENSFRKKLMASVFLNIKTKRFEEDFESQVRAVTGAERKEQPVQQLTKEEKERLFK